MKVAFNRSDDNASFVGPKTATIDLIIKCGQNIDLLLISHDEQLKSIYPYVLNV